MESEQIPYLLSSQLIVRMHFLWLFDPCISVGNASNSVKFSESDLILSYTRLSIQLSVPKIKFNHRWTTKDGAVENTGIFCGPSFSLCSTSSQYLAINNVFFCSFYQTLVHHPASVIQKNMFPHVQSPFYICSCFHGFFPVIEKSAIVKCKSILMFSL